MKRSSGMVKPEDVEMEKIEEFYEWLQGKSCPECLYFENKLNLTEEQSFSVIYFLQEYLKIIPDNYERCQECGRIFDTDYEGISISEGTEFPKEMYGIYCDNCRPD